jgi:hypothetical protein
MQHRLRKPAILHRSRHSYINLSSRTSGLFGLRALLTASQGKCDSYLFPTTNRTHRSSPIAAWLGTFNRGMLPQSEERSTC